NKGKSKQNQLKQNSSCQSTTNLYRQTTPPRQFISPHQSTSNPSHQSTPNPPHQNSSRQSTSHTTERCPAAETARQSSSELESEPDPVPIYQRSSSMISIEELDKLFGVN
ncbi:16012_t:CDS:2, partial [Gigaspora margarita]